MLREFQGKLPVSASQVTDITIAREKKRKAKKWFENFAQVIL